MWIKEKSLTSYFNPKQTKFNELLTYVDTKTGKVYLEEKVVGRLMKNIYFKPIVYSKHFFKRYNGFGISKKILNLLENTCKYALIFDTENNQYYYFRFSDFKLKGKEYDNEGDIQYILDINFQCSLEEFGKG